MEQKTSLTEIIEYIDPGSLNYQEWINVGMALKQEGYSVNVWDMWSSRDIGRYHRGGMCAKMEFLFRLVFSCNRRDHRSDGTGPWLDT